VVSRTRRRDVPDRNSFGFSRPPLEKRDLSSEKRDIEAVDQLIKAAPKRKLELSEAKARCVILLLKTQSCTAPRVFAPWGWHPHADDPSVWIDLRHLAVQRIGD
jgi:hypothetical protein